MTIKRTAEIREAAEKDLFTFAKLVTPRRMYGHVHQELMRWMTRAEAFENQLILLPRAHQKSHIGAVWTAWWLTNHPETTILYVSATADLAEKQLYAIKNLLTSTVYKRYWPEMLHVDEGKRERWTTSEIIVDHPKRKAEGVRDPSIKAVGLQANYTGFHADVIVYDDVVVPDNAYTEEGRRKTAAACSQIASIRNAGGITKAFGTRYHPKDQYFIFKSQVVDIFDPETFASIDKQPRWEIFERVVEEEGEFLWPLQIRKDGKAFGFNLEILSQIKAEYEDRAQFYAQYYNDPNDPESQQIDSSLFQYYERKFIEQRDGYWYFKDRRLNIGAAIDFAFSTAKTADYTAIVVVGVDQDRNTYVLDIDKFKTDGKIGVYFDHIFKIYSKWNFRRLRVEVNVAQKAIAESLKERFTMEGLPIILDEFRPNRHEGAKEERVAAILEPKYTNRQVWHYRGGNCQSLEEELVAKRPPHDDIKDAFAAAVSMVRPPPKAMKSTGVDRVAFNSRFGGVSYK